MENEKRRIEQWKEQKLNAFNKYLILFMAFMILKNHDEIKKEILKKFTYS